MKWSMHKEALREPFGPIPMANRMIGAVLSTGGMTSACSVPGVMDFVKQQSIACVDSDGYNRLVDDTVVLTSYEGFDTRAISSRNKVQNV